MHTHPSKRRSPRPACRLGAAMLLVWLLLAGSMATFTVAASSGSALTYQWYFQSTAIVGATSGSYTLKNILPADAGFYYVAVRNVDGTVNSTNAVLTVTAQADVVTTVAGPSSVFATSNFTYTVTVKNLGPSTATNVLVSDVLPAGLTVVGASGGGNIVAAGGLGQVVFDRAFSIVDSNLVAGTLTWTHVTTNGLNRLLLVGVSLAHTNGSPAVTTLAYGGRGLTKVRALTNGLISSELWQLVNPPSGSNSVSLTFVGNPTTLVAGGATFSGVDQVMPLSDTNSASGNSKTASVTVSSATNEIVFDTLCTGKDKAKTLGAGQTQLWYLNGAESGSASIKPGTNLVTMSWTQVQIFDWAQIAASVKPLPLIGAVTWTIPSLAAGATTNFTVTVTAPFGGYLTNEVSSTATTPDADPANNNGGAAAQVVTAVVPIADVVTTQSGPASVAPLTNYTYTVTVSNRGPSAATNVVAVDTLAPTLAFVSADSGGTYLGGTVSWPAVARLVPGAATNFTVTVRSPITGSLTNTASSTATTIDPSPVDNDGSKEAAQAVTAVSPLAVDNTSKGGGNVSSLTWSHPVSSGSSRILIVGVSLASTNVVVNSVYYNTILPLTKIGETNGPQTRVAMFRLLNPPIGTFPVSVTLSAVAGVVGGAVSFNGVNQTNPIAAFVGNTGTGTVAGITVPSTLGGVVIDAVAPMAPVVATNLGVVQSLEWNLPGTNVVAVTNYTGAGSSSPGALSATPSWTLDKPAN